MGGQVPTPRAAASIAYGLRSTWSADLHRRALTSLLAAIAHATGSQDHRAVSYGPDGVAYLGGPPSLAAARLN